MSEAKKKYASALSWWAADEQRPLVKKYAVATERLVEVLTDARERQKEEVEGVALGGDAPRHMLRRVLSVLEAQIECDPAAMIVELIELRGLTEAATSGAIVAESVQQSVRTIKDLMKSPEELLNMLAGMGVMPRSAEEEGEQLGRNIAEADPGEAEEE